MSCLICCEMYNNSTKKKTQCPYCEFESCRTCCQTYMLNETIIKCMNPEKKTNGELKCGKEWSRKFIRDSFPNTFINTKLKTHMSNVLLEQERALLPATQPVVEDQIRKEKIKIKTDEIDKKIRELSRKKSNLVLSLYNVNYTKEPAKFIRACSDTNCRGFLSTQWKCGICEQWTCPDCHELKGPNKDVQHTCDANNVETAKLLVKDTKSCPKCRTQIFKISGCDQMWCTQCHTGFSWKTGNIENNIHNPHYYEWQRRNGGLTRAVGDIECGRELDHRTSDAINQLIRFKHINLIAIHKSKPLANPLARPTPLANPTPTPTQIRADRLNIIRIVEVIRNTIHLIRVELPTYQVNYVAKNQELRIRYLRNIITEEQFKEQLQRNDKRHKKNTEFAQVFQLMNTSITDIVFRIIDNLKKSEPNNYDLSIVFEIDEIIKYCNEILKDISYTYSSVQYKFTDNINLTKVEVVKKNKDASAAAFNNNDNKITEIQKKITETNNVIELYKA